MKLKPTIANPRFRSLLPAKPRNYSFVIPGDEGGDLDLLTADDFRKRKTIPRGAGGSGKSGGGGSSTPTEDPDSLQSVAFVSLLEMLCEGTIQGIVPGETGAQTDNVYLDGVPLTSLGVPNFDGYTIGWTLGSQDQGVLPGFGSVYSTQSLGTQIRQATPVQAAINNMEANAVVMTVAVDQLYTVDTGTGDIHGTSVDVVLEYLPSGTSNWVTAADMTITGKTRSRYQRSVRINLTGTGPWLVRARRTTADSASTYLANNTFLDAVETVVDQQLSYPNSALVGLHIDARQFSSIPTPTFLIDGLLIRVPNNYDPVSRIYSGSWNGGFKLAYSNNPAWCLYDMLTETRYGLGNYLQNAQIDKTALYQIGQYCDEMIPDGFGGLEPRFTCNLVINTAKEAYQVIQDMLSIFRGMSYWAEGNIMITQDAPRTPGPTFTKANVVDGKFTYQGTALKDRHSVALVNWNDPAQQYQQNTEYVENTTALARFGVKTMQLMAVGCTSRGQAHRVGQWALISELSDTDQVTFTAGMEGASLTPGTICSVADPTRSIKRIGGRIVKADANTVTLDAPVVLDAGQTYSLTYYDGTGAQYTAAVANTVNTTQVLQFLSPVANIPQSPFIWELTGSNLVPQTFRVLSVKESSRNKFDVTAVTYNASKYNAIDYNTQLILPPIGYGNTIAATVPTAWSLTETTFLTAPGTVGEKLLMTWSGNTTRYMIQWRVNGGLWTSDTVRSPGYEIDGVTKGDIYDFRVYGISSDGSLSASLDETYTVRGISSPPGACANLTAGGDFRAVNLAWSAPGDLDLDYFQVAMSTTNNLATAGIVGDKIGSTNWQVGGLTTSVTYYFWVRAVDTSGNVGPWNSNVGTAGTPTIVSVIEMAIIGTAQIADASITTAKIADANITSAKIGTAQIVSAHIANAQITTAHIGVAQIDTLRIGGNAVTTMASWGGLSTNGDATSYWNFSYGGSGGTILLLVSGSFSSDIQGTMSAVLNGAQASISGALVTTTGTAYVPPFTGTATVSVAAKYMSGGLVTVFEAKR